MTKISTYIRLLSFNLFIFTIYTGVANAEANIAYPPNPLSCPNLPKGTYSNGQQLDLEGNTWSVWLGQSGDLYLPYGITWPTNQDWNYSYSVSGMSGNVGSPVCSRRDNSGNNRIAIILMANNYSCSDPQMAPFDYHCNTNSFKFSTPGTNMTQEKLELVYKQLNDTKNQ